MCFVDSTSAVAAEVDCQFLASLMHCSILFSGARNDAELVLREKKIECVGTTTDLATGQAEAWSLYVGISQC